LATALSLKSRIITQMIAVAVFVMVPILITLMAPFTDLTFHHDPADGATVTVKRYVLMFIPWRTSEITSVRMIRPDINQAFRYGNTAENRRKSRVGTISHATGQVAVIGDAHEEIVQAAPEIAKDISIQFQQFLRNRTAADKTISVYASWPLSYLLGGALTALAALYVVGSCLAIITLAFKWVRRSSFSR
jgi:hypothetical protein